jgi:hypothetical protein
VPEQDADVLEVLIGKMGKDRDVDAVLCIAARARLNFGPVDLLNGRFYPIDRLARNRPKRTSEGKCLRTQRPLAEIAGRAVQRRQTRTRDAAEAIGRSTIAFLDRTG